MMRLEKAQGMLPVVSEGHRASPPSAGHSQLGVRGPSSDGNAYIPAATAGDGAPGMALPAVSSGPNRSPSRRVAQPPGSPHTGFLASRHAQSTASFDGTSRFSHNGISTANGGAAPATAADLLACHSVAIFEPAGGAANPAPAPALHPAADGVNYGPNSDDRPPLPAAAAPPIGATPPAFVSSNRGRRSLPNGAMMGPNGRPSGARRSLSPNPMERQAAAARAAGGGGACPLAHGTSTVPPYCRAPLPEAPNSPAGPKQPRPPLQVPVPFPLDDPLPTALHAGGLLSPRVIRLQLGAPAPLQPLGSLLRAPSGRQVMDSEEPQERSSAPERLLADHMSAFASSGAAAAAAAEAAAPAGISSGDAKQMSMLMDLAAAVGELQRRVAEMAPRLPQDATAVSVSEAGSGYSLCASNRSSAPGTVNGDLSNLSCVFSGIGPWAPPAPAAASASGACAVDERISQLEAQMKQLAGAVFDAASKAAAAAAPSPPPPATTANVSGGGCGGGSGSGSSGPAKVLPLQFWSEPGEAATAQCCRETPAAAGAAAPGAGGLASATTLGLALGLAAVTAAQLQGGAAFAGGSSRRRHGMRAPPAGLFSSATPDSRTSEAASAAAVAAAAAALERVQALEQRIDSLTTRLADAERTASAAKQDSSAAAAAAAAANAAATAAAAAATAEEARQRQLREQQQAEVRAAAAEAVAAAVQANARRQDQLQARLTACEERLRAAGTDGAAHGDRVDFAVLAAPRADDESESSFSTRLREVEDALAKLVAKRQASDAADGGCDAAAPAAPPTAGPAAADWQRALQALTQQVQDMALQVTSARAQSSSVAAEVQVVLEQVRGVQATAAAAAASARHASTAAAAAERSAAAALDVVDAAATGTRATGGPTRHRCRSISGGDAAAAASGSASGGGGTAASAARPAGAVGLRSPRRSEVWLADPRAAAQGTAAAAPSTAVYEQQEEEEDESDGDEAEMESHSADATAAAPPPPPAAGLPGRRLAARDVGFRILPDGADVITGGGATLYGVSASRTSVLEGALRRLADVEASLQDVRSKLGRGMALRVTHDELRESVAQLDLKMRAVLAGLGAGGAGAGGLYSRSASLAASIGFRAFSAVARLGGDGGGGASAASAAPAGGDRGDEGGGSSGNEGRGGGAAAGRQSGGQTEAASGQPVAAWAHGRVSDSVSSRGERLVLQGDAGAALVQLQRSVGIVEQRLEAVEAGVAQCGAVGERVAAVAEQLQQLQQHMPQPPLQQQQRLWQQASAAERSALAPHSRNSSVARRYGNGGGGSVVLLGLEEQLTHRAEAGGEEGSQRELGRDREGRAAGVEQAATPTLRAQGTRGRELARSGARSGALRGGQ